MRTAALYTMTSFYALVFFFFVSVVLMYFTPKRWHSLLTVFLGLVTAFIDVQSSEVSFSILLLLAFSFFLGFTKPAIPLRTALLFAVWLPLAAFMHLALLGSNSAFLAEGVGSFIAFIPALGGSYLGAFIRRHSEDSLLTPDAIV
jgi:hypothetical protein